MKIAVLIFGEYRTFESAINTWNCKFWDNVDYYMSTWDYSLEPVERVRHALTVKWERYADENFIRKELPNVTLKISNSKDEEYIKNHDTNKMIYHWKTLYNMVNESGKEYDYIFLVRTDSYFFVKPEFFQNTKKDILYVESENEFGVGDIFFFGHGDVILEFLKNYPTKVGEPHSALLNYLKTNYKYKFDVALNCDMGVYYGLIRPTSESAYEPYKQDKLEEDDLDPGFIHDEFIDMLRESDSSYIPGRYNILLIGEKCEDIFVYGNIDRLSPEAPIPILNPIETISNEGMAGNVKRQMQELWQTPDFITNNNEVTKTRYVDKSTNYIKLRVDEGDEKIEKIDLSNLPDKIYDVIVFSDYDKGLVSGEDIEKIMDFYQEKLNNRPYNQKKLLSFIDTKKNFGDWLKNIDFIKVNYKEYEKNIEYINNNDWIKEKLIVTRGPFGCDYNGKNYPNKEVPIKDLSGAGDTFLSALVVQYIISKNIDTSIEYANKISEMAVQRKGVSVITPQEINTEFNFKIL
mgnify:CR=1 FL=1|tara:strand:+ start:3106 stop:4662 length:1557 start_codon:yes stop_codon:yes gene_type:complete